MNHKEWDKQLRNLTIEDLKTVIDFANVIIMEKRIENQELIENFKEAFNALKENNITVYALPYEGEPIQDTTDFRFDYE